MLKAVVDIQFNREDILKSPYPLHFIMRSFDRAIHKVYKDDLDGPKLDFSRATPYSDRELNIFAAHKQLTLTYIRKSFFLAHIHKDDYDIFRDTVNNRLKEWCVKDRLGLNGSQVRFYEMCADLLIKLQPTDDIPREEDKLYLNYYYKIPVNLI